MPKPVEKIAVSDDITRICKVCKIPKQLNLEFLFHSTYSTYSHCCKDCHNRRSRIKRAGLPEPEEFKVLNKKIKIKKVFENKPWRSTSHANRKRLDYKALDKRKGITSDLTVEYMEKSLSSPCLYCGFPSVGLDRIDNSKGHTMDNSVPACYECNIARNQNFSHEEMKILGKTIREIKLNRDHGST